MTEVDLPAGNTVEDGIVAESGYIRILLKGEWAFESNPGVWSDAGQIALFGANSRALKIRLTGHCRFVSVAVRPSAWRNLFRERAHHYADKVVPLQEDWGAEADSLRDQARAAADDDALVAVLERAITARKARIARKRIDQPIALLEQLARTNSTMRMDDAAEQLEMSVRQMERRCLDTFGHSPKLVFQRSRFLDMAETMRGLAKPGEELLARLRYFDESHLNREYRRFIGTTPGRFAKGKTPLLDAILALRFEGKVIE
jgi:AraC-like DNA-binding protein